MTVPPHAVEHDQLMQLVAKVTDRSQLIAATILVTIGHDGRPCIGSDLDSPSVIHRILREIAAAEDQVVDVSKVTVPRDN